MEKTFGIDIKGNIYYIYIYIYILFKYWREIQSYIIYNENIYN